MSDLPNWERLYKALSVEAERGFQDLMGKQYRFSEFMTLTFGEPLKVGLRPHRMRWNSLGTKFQQYPRFSVAERQTAIAEARRLLEDLQQSLSSSPPPDSKTPPRQHREHRDAVRENQTTAQTQPLSDRAGTAFSLDRPLREIPEIRRRKIAKSLEERLGLRTVRDALFYYPRDHIDYSRQVNIANLEAGATVTLVGTVKRCNCFTSPKNKKLSIFELILRDRTGQVKLNRFFGGGYFTNRGWQERLKRQYPPGCIVAASGLVKQNKYGITLDNPEIEVLDGPGAS
ncbi:MAG: OB-fold nucleic acid binding domain-containing protein, partial [Cyanobacteriota bacterium]|nr:OB-fold nucleic acid binding domain-containing protein [Cyanobacteriota bacterium]